MFVVITGPVRSGKSTFALRLARERGGRLVYVATAWADNADAEMRDRLARHRADRPDFATIELDRAQQIDLADVLGSATADQTLVIDSLGSWIGNALADQDAAADHDAAAVVATLERRTATLATALAQTPAHVFIVCEETGWGVVPASALGRIFRDVMGRASAELVRNADAAYLVVAGRALDLLALGRPV